MRYQQLVSLLLLGISARYVEAVSGSGTSTRYWDCCKPSCAWPGKANVSEPVYTCSSNDQTLSNYSAVSGCESGGTAYTCTSQEPWALNSLVSYGFAATAISGGTEASWCCACYALTFTSGKAKGKIMVVQSINTGSDLSNNQFDLQIPGGGEGIFDGCSSEFGGIAGARYGGISNRSQCASMPAALQPGCDWRFDWFNNADNPTHTFTQVSCPAELVAKTGCRRTDDGNFPAFTMPSVTTWTTPTPTATAAAYAQCDSLEWDVAEACPSGYVCTYNTDYYWQCAPAPSGVGAPSSSAKPTTSSSSSSSSSKASSPPSSSNPSTASSAPATGTVTAWGQCNTAACAAGLKCVYLNEYYSQCQPTS